jgi:hypothetical protein
VSIAEVFHRPLRRYAAAVCLAGAALAAFSAVVAAVRLGPGESAAFAAVAVVSTVLAAGVLMAARWALWTWLVVAGGQVTAVVGTALELAYGVDAAKARQIRKLGFDPDTGVVINLVYSGLALASFGWLAARWLRLRHHARQCPPAR